MFNIAENLNHFWDWISTLSLSSIVNTYWFLFYIEMPRYYILEYLVIFWRLMDRNKREKEMRLPSSISTARIPSSASWCRERTKARTSIRW